MGLWKAREGRILPGKCLVSLLGRPSGGPRILRKGAV